MEDSNLFSELTIHAEKTAVTLIQKLKELSLTLALSESCTAGMVSSVLAGVPGAFSVLWGGFVCYTKEAKVSMLDIEDEYLAVNGLVSRETASLMAVAALKKSGACIAASVTGLAGPFGDGSNVPVGSVCIAVAEIGGVSLTKEYFFKDNRKIIRIRATIAVLETILSILPNE
jgi:PncC family amidohydrolase